MHACSCTRAHTQTHTNAFFKEWLLLLLIVSSLEKAAEHSLDEELENNLNFGKKEEPHSGFCHTKPVTAKICQSSRQYVLCTLKFF